MGSTQRPHLVPLGDTGWAAWRDVVLRSAGFPATSVQALCDPELAAAADAAVRDPAALPAYRAEHPAAAERLSAAVQKVAAWPRFREAVTWQNPKLVKWCLDKLADEGPRNVRR